MPVEAVELIARTHPLRGCCPNCGEELYPALVRVGDDIGLGAHCDDCLHAFTLD